MRTLRIASQLDVAFNAQLRRALPDAEVLDWPRGVFAGLPADVQVMLAAPQPKLLSAEEPVGWPYGLQFIQLVTSGIDFFPPWLLERVPVASARGATAEAIAEFVLASVFGAAKQLPALWINDASQWQQRPLASVSGSTLGLFGFGSIARSTAHKALALGMNVVALRGSATPFDLPGIQPARDIHDLFARADHLLLAAPASAHTYRVVNRAVLASAKPGLHLINVARGSLIDQDALREALDTGQIGLASLDVTDPEPLPDGHWLYRHARVRLSPHTSAHSPQVYLNIAALLAHNIQRWRAGEALENAVLVAHPSPEGVPA